MRFFPVVAAPELDIQPSKSKERIQKNPWSGDFNAMFLSSRHKYHYSQQKLAAVMRRKEGKRILPYQGALEKHLVRTH